jgi:hypothetical protein
MTVAPQTCYRCNVQMDKLLELGLKKYADARAIQFWGGKEKDE